MIRVIKRTSEGVNPALKAWLAWARDNGAVVREAATYYEIVQ